MNFNLHENAEAYLHLHADCMPVKGATRSAIYDLTRKELIFFPSEYYEVLEYLTSDKIGRLISSLECEEEKKLVIDFINFLDNSELIIFLKDVSLFPAIEERWETPSIIENAIIDIDSELHNFDKIFTELDELGCQYVQIRSFSDFLKLEDLYHILSYSNHKTIRSVELIIKYDPNTSDEAYIELIENVPVISGLTLHSSPEERMLVTDYGLDEDRSRYIKKGIYLVTQGIDSNLHCGIITTKALNAPSVDNFFETKMYNGCLNKKVSIDVYGEIKNCPSMVKSYGNLKNTNLNSAIDRPGFKDKWEITKDQIEICKDCEFRYVCSDCRAFTEDPLNLYSKPLKCGYNPYTCEWKEWSENPLKQEAIEYYGMKKLTEKKNESVIINQSQLQNAQ